MTTLQTLNESAISRLIEQALVEDLGFGDIGTESIILEEELKTAHIVSRDDGILAGLEIAELVYRYVDMQITVTPLARDGERVLRGKSIAHIHGPLRGIIQGERTALNFLMRMSGIATATRRYVNMVQDTGVRIIGTRETVPAIRLIDILALKIGGGYLPKSGPDDCVYITHHHIRAAGGVSHAITKAISFLKKFDLNREIIVEISSPEELQETIEYSEKINRVILRTFPVETLSQVVNMVGGKMDIEVSGDIPEHTLREIAESGVQYISVGELTHSPRAMLFSLLIDSR